jgi:hypothetical protein
LGASHCWRGDFASVTERPPGDAEASVVHPRVRRAVVLFLAILTLVVFLRAIGGAHGAPGTAPPDLPDLFGRARVGLFDPEGTAESPLLSLGLRVETFSRFQGLALYSGDLVVVGPGGFGREREALGPVLAARARAGMPILILAQSSFPGTLSEDLRLWPSFARGPATSVLLAAGHPVLQGLSGDRGARYLEQATAGLRPFLPPPRGNFSMVAALRDGDGPVAQEAAAILEYRIGGGTILAIQAPLCADFDRDGRARMLLANALAYLLGPRLAMKHACLLGPPGVAPPDCIARLAPFTPAAPADLDGVDLLLVPADWRALRTRGAGGFPPLALVARYLRQGGTVVLLDPQPLVHEDLSSMLGAPVFFDAPARAAGTGEAAPALLQGIAPADLALLATEGRAEIRLRSSPGPEGVEPLLLAPGLARYRVGRGTLVALMLPGAGACGTPRVATIVARLLTNLGVPLDARPGLDPESITRLDDPLER